MPSLWPFGKQRTVRCPDGTQRYVYKNIDHAMPLSVGVMQAKFEAATTALTRAQARVKGEYAQRVAGLLFELDKANRNMALSFRTIYMV